MTHRLCLMYTMDPRGQKIGGIETHIRLILQHHPADFSVLFVGLDEFGDCRIGEVVPLTIAGRRIDFLPVAHVPGERINRAAGRLAQSHTLAYVAGALRHLGALRRAVGEGPASADLHRFEFAPVARLLGIPVCQMVHGEGAKGDRMDSLIKRYWFVHRANEELALRLADRVFAVNPNILRRYAAELPRIAAKAELLTVSVDGGLFAEAPFDTRDGVLRILFAGRLDEFKDPPLMFRTIAQLKQRLAGKVEFHYVGATDPARYPDFAAIADVTKRHGFQPASGVARIAATCHAGILTSFFEGMPCFLLETLAVGRPFGAIRLPQYDALLAPAVSGIMVERGDDEAKNAARLADGFVALWAGIRAGTIRPDAVRAKIAPYLVETQMTRLFERHRQLQDRRWPPPRAVQPPVSATISSTRAA